VKRTKILILFLCVLFAQHAIAQTKPFAIAVIGDSGCGCTGQKEVADRMYSWWQKYPFNIVLMLGDNIYPSSRFRGGSRYLFVDRFDNPYRPLLEHGVKFFATIGNHDLETAHGADVVNDMARFHVLQPQGYYSFKPDVVENGKPLVEFFCLNSNRLLKQGSDPEQLVWLSNALTSSTAIWKIAFFHHPIYSPDGPHEAELGLRAGIERLLVASGVRLVLAGHSHYYARMLPQSGILHLVSGGGGMSLKTPRPNADTAKYLKAFHFLYLEIFPDRLEFWAIPTSGLPFDHGVLSVQTVPAAQPGK
jgi:acid phosphatase